MLAQPELATTRLILRPFTMHDAPDVQRLAGEFAVADTTGNIPHPYPDGVAEQWIATHQPQYEAGSAAIFAIILRTSVELIGAISLGINRHLDSAELGYWLGTPYWGQGYCTEAGRAVLAFGFGTLGLNRIHACFVPRNLASGRVMEKLGMTREGIARQNVKKDDRYEDRVNYGILREEWTGD